MQISLILPTLNEAESIAAVLGAIPRDMGSEIIVVDGGSTDGTVEIARSAGAKVYHEPRRGYGRACASGLERAGGDVVAFMDADGADDPAQIPLIVEPVLKGRADLVLGSRLAGQLQPGAMPWHQRFGNRLAAAMFRVLYGLAITDLSPFRAAPRRQLLELGMREMTYGWPTEMIARAARCGWRIQEVPVHYRPRIGGASKISGTLRGTVLATYYILGSILRYRLAPTESGRQ
jgi:glycosyltransferase involved in cell wall biosynthesis